MSNMTGMFGALIGFVLLLVVLLFLQFVGMILAVLSGLFPETFPNYCWLISGLLLLTGASNYFIPTEDAKSRIVFRWSVFSTALSLVCLTNYLLSLF